MNIEKLTAEQLTQELVAKKIDINLINPLKQTQKSALLDAIKTRPNLITTISAEKGQTLLPILIKANPKFFIYLDRSQYTDELAQIFLTARFAPAPSDKRTVSESTKTHKLTTHASLDNKIVFDYSYVSPDDDELYYFDSELQVPASIRSSIKASMKLVDAIKLIDKLDTHITILGENKIDAVINDIISNQYKAFLYNYINQKKVGYYTPCTSLDEIQSGIIEKLNETFSAYGITVIDFIVKKIAIPKDIQNKVEDLSFEIRQRRADVEANAEFAKLSLENYETKLSIQNKFPNSEHSLTEYEKDLALKRYLIKTGRLEETEIDHSISLQQKLDKTDAKLKKVDDFEPKEQPEPTKMSFKSKFILWAVLCGIFTIIMFSQVGTGAGFICLALFTAIFGIIGATNSAKFKEQPTQDNNNQNTNSDNKDSSNNG